MKKLLIATDCFLPRWDGIARFLNEIIPNLSKDYNITIIAPHYGKSPYMENVKLITVPTRKIKLGDYSPAKITWKKVRNEVEKTDIIFVQTQGPIGMRAVVLGKILKKPIISYVHSIEWELFSKSMPYMRPIVKFFTKLYAKFLYNMSDMLFVPFLELKEIMRRYGIKSPEMVVVRLGTDVEKFKPAEDKFKAKEKIGIDPERFVIGFTGRISREKSLKTLIHAFKELQKEYKNLSLLVVGKGVEKIETELKISKNIIAVGKRDDIVPYLQAMDVFVMPSLTETTSLSTIEAMSCAVPVVVTPVGYVKSYVKDKFNGLVFPVGNSLVLKLKLKQLIEDNTLREMLSKHARATIVKKFNWEKTVERLKFVLKQF